MFLSLHDLLGLSAVGSSIFVYFSPLPTVLNFIKRGSTQNVSGVPYVFMIGSNFLWGIYGILSVDYMYTLTCVIGFLLAMVFTISFWLYVPKKTNFSMICLSVLSTLSLLVAYIFLTYPDTAQRKQQLGLLACGVSGVMISSPLLQLRQVCASKSTASLPFTFCLANSASAILWLLYSFINRDLFMTMAYGAASCFCLLQLSLFVVDYLFWRRSRIKDLEKGSPKNISKISKNNRSGFRSLTQRSHTNRMSASPPPPNVYKPFYQIDNANQANQQQHSRNQNKIEIV